MQCNILWNTLSLDEWQSYFDCIAQSNILQSYHYAQASCAVNRQKACWGLIQIDGKDAGLVQMLEAGILWNAFHTVMIDRGPLWFTGFGGAAHIKLFFDTINAEFPNRFGRKRRFIPEINAGLAAEGILKQCGLQKVEGEPGYQTLWWNLGVDEKQARANLKSNWRGSLQKAEASDVQIIWDDTGKFYPWLKAIYTADKAVRGYEGASPQLLDNLAKFSTQQNPMIIGKAVLNGSDIATVMFLKHGKAATYQVGWSSDQGRQYCAHHLLLWQARSILKECGVEFVDLGGVNAQAAGIKKFKEGTGAQSCQLVGRFS